MTIKTTTSKISGQTRQGPAENGRTPWTTQTMTYPRTLRPGRNKLHLAHPRRRLDSLHPHHQHSRLRHQLRLQPFLSHFSSAYCTRPSRRPTHISILMPLECCPHIWRSSSARRWRGQSWGRRKRSKLGKWIKVTKGGWRGVNWREWLRV